MTNKVNIKKIALASMLCALAYIMMFVFRFKVAFLTFDFKDAVISVASFSMGPLYGIVISAVVAFLEFFTVSDTGVYGLIMNFLASGTFALTTGLIYKYKRSFTGAVTAVVFASLSVIAVMLLANLFITPLYMGVDRSFVIAKIPVLLLPFNSFKVVSNSAAALIIYKPFTNVLKRIGLISGTGNKVNLRYIILAVICVIVVVLSALFIVLGMNGVFELYRW